LLIIKLHRLPSVSLSSPPPARESDRHGSPSSRLHVSGGNADHALAVDLFDIADDAFVSDDRGDGLDIGINDREQRARRWLVAV